MTENVFASVKDLLIEHGKISPDFNQQDYNEGLESIPFNPIYCYASILDWIAPEHCIVILTDDFFDDLDSYTKVLNKINDKTDHRMTIQDVKLEVIEEDKVKTSYTLNGEARMIEHTTTHASCCELFLNHIQDLLSQTYDNSCFGTWLDANGTLSAMQLDLPLKEKLDAIEAFKMQSA